MLRSLPGRLSLIAMVGMLTNLEDAFARDVPPRAPSDKGSDLEKADSPAQLYLKESSQCNELSENDRSICMKRKSRYAQSSGNQENIVVTATGYKHKVETAPASISIVGKKELETQPFRDLTDALRNVEGVAVTGVSNEKDIFIRGLPGSYTLLLVDGRRQNTRDSRTNGNSGFEQSFMPPEEAIDHIEVVKGSMSSLYGTDAIGGVINVITRKIPKKWEGSASFDYTAQQYSRDGDNFQGQGYIAGPIFSDKVGMQVWGRRYDRTESKILNGLNNAEDYDVNGRITGRPAQGHEIVLEAGRQGVRRENTSGNTLAANSSDNYNTNDRNHYGAWYDGHFGKITTWTSFQSEDTQRYTYNENLNTGRFVKNVRAPHVRNLLGDFRVTIPFLKINTLTLGGQWIDTSLRDQNPGLRDNVTHNYHILQQAGFVEDELAITKSLSLTGGIRMDNHQIYGTRWSPRGYLVYKFPHNLVLKGGVSTGFRAPEIREIAPGYAYTTGGGNCTYGPNGTCAVIIGAPDLKPETSTSYEANLHYYGRNGFEGGLTFFRNDFRNQVQNVQQFDANGNFVRWAEDPNYRLYYWTNIDKSRTQGIEANFRWSPIQDLILKGNYTFTDSKQLSGTYKGYALARTPRHMASGSVEWKVLPRLTTFFRAWYHGQEVNAALRAGSNGTSIPTSNGATVRLYGDYFTAETGATYRMKNGLMLNFAIQNLTDKRLNELQYNTVSEGRHFWMSTTYRF